MPQHSQCKKSLLLCGVLPNAPSPNPFNVWVSFPWAGRPVGGLKRRMETTAPAPHAFEDLIICVSVS